MPDDAQLSDDGNYWWDGEQWQPVDGGGGSDDTGSGAGDTGGDDGSYGGDGYGGGDDAGGDVGGGDGGGGDGGQATFDFDVNGLRIDAESSPVPSAGEPLKAAFAVCNTGTAAGSAHVTIYIDGSDSGVSWDSPSLEPGDCAAPDGDGYVHGLPAQEEGDHEFGASADPPGQNGWTTNTITVGSAE